MARYFYPALLKCMSVIARPQLIEVLDDPKIKQLIHDKTMHRFRQRFPEAFAAPRPAAPAPSVSSSQKLASTGRAPGAKQASSDTASTAKFAVATESTAPKPAPAVAAAKVVQQMQRAGVGAAK
jgi:predicted lipid-binding transport protein (Tim44 family)